GLRTRRSGPPPTLLYTLSLHDALPILTAVCERAVECFGRIDVVFANAGIANDPPTTLAAADLDAYERVIEVDLLGVVRTIKPALDRKSTRLNSSHLGISYAVFCLKKKT